MAWGLQGLGMNPGSTLNLQPAIPSREAEIVETKRAEP